MNIEEAKVTLSEIIFQICDGELDWGESLALGEPALKAIEGLISTVTSGDV